MHNSNCIASSFFHGSHFLSLKAVRWNKSFQPVASKMIVPMVVLQAVCHVLLLAVTLRQRVSDSELSKILELSCYLATDVGVLHHVDRLRQYIIVLFTFLLTLLPLEGVQDQQLQDDTEALRLIASSVSLDQRVRSFIQADPSNAHVALIRFIWGVLSLSCDVVTDAAISDVVSALDDGAISLLGEILRLAAFVEEAEEIRIIIASVAHQLLMLFVEVANEGIAVLQERTQSQQSEELKESSSLDTKSLDYVSGSWLPHFGDGVNSLKFKSHRKDTMASLMDAVGITLRMHPGLFLDESRRAPELGTLSQLGSDVRLCMTPSFLISYICFWTNIASTSIGARSVFHNLLHSSAPQFCSWRRMFYTLQEVIKLYGGMEKGAKQGSQEPVVLPKGDTLTLCAFAYLFEQVFIHGPNDEIAAWLRQLDEESGVSPSWDILFWTMCCPVPQILKAALDRALAAIAHSEIYGPALWDRLLSAVVVLPFQPLTESSAHSTSSAPPIPQYDMSYQFEKIQAEDRDYMESIAFVSFLNALWKSTSAGALDDGGRRFVHFTRFIRQKVLCGLFQREFQNEVQRWELATVALDHCRTCLETSPLDVGIASRGIPTPASEIVYDVVNEGPACRAALQCLKLGVDTVARERWASPLGKHKEEAILSSLRLFGVAFDIDIALVSEMQKSDVDTSYESMASMLEHDRSRVFEIIDFVRYPYSADIQKESLLLIKKMVLCIPDLVQLLISNSMGNDTTDMTRARLMDGFGTCLSLSLEDLGREDSFESRPILLLDLLVSCLDLGTPNLTHLVCGFDITSGTMPFRLPDDRGQSTALHVVLEELKARSSSSLHPRVFELGLKLVLRLCENLGSTGPATLELLRLHHESMIFLLRDVAASVVEEKDPPSLLHQKAWLFKIIATQLYAIDPAISTEKLAADNILAEVRSPPSGQNGTLLEDALNSIIEKIPSEPTIFQSCPKDLLRILQVLDVENCLAAVQKMGVYGDTIFDENSLKDALLQRYKELVTRQDGVDEDMVKRAAHIAITFAADYNAWSQHIGGQLHALQGWRQLMEVVFTKAYDTGIEGSSFVNMIISVLESCLHGIQELLRSCVPTMASTLVGAAEMLLARLHEIADYNMSASGIFSLISNHQYHSILNSCCNILWHGRSQDAVRLSVARGLVFYFSLCRGSFTLLRAPKAGEPASCSVWKTDPNKEALEEGNVMIMHGNLRVLGLLAGDVAGSDTARSLAAASALSAWLATDPTVVSADELHATALPSRILQDLVEHSSESIAQPGMKGNAQALLLQARLMLLVRLAAAGPPSQRATSAQKIASIQAIPCISSAVVLSIQPEEPGFEVMDASWSLRHRLHKIVGPALQLVLIIATQLAQSTLVFEQALSFVHAHDRMLARLLRDVVSTGVGGWEPGGFEFEQASLAMYLLQELMQRRAEIPLHIHEAIYRVASRLFTSDSRSPCPKVARLKEKRESGRQLSLDDIRTYDKVITLRCSVAGFIRAALPFVPLSLVQTKLSTDSVPLSLFAIKDALLQASLDDFPLVLAQLQNYPEMINENQALVASSIMRRILGRLLYLIEQLLSILYEQLMRYKGNGDITDANNNKGGVSRHRGLQSHDEFIRGLQHLRRLLEPALLSLERISVDGSILDGNNDFGLLLRRLKDVLFDLLVD